MDYNYNSLEYLLEFVWIETTTTPDSSIRVHH